jgi:hypothetical protein
MEIRILLDYGQGYNVSLTPSDARHLWEQLNGLFSPKVTTALDPAFFKPLGTRGYETVVTSNTEAKAEESPKTLRDDHFYTDGTCKCMEVKSGS